LFFYVFEKVKKLDKNKKYPEKITDQSKSLAFITESLFSAHPIARDTTHNLSGNMPWLYIHLSHIWNYNGLGINIL